ncbi:class I SAM-dependent methyltransferase [Roseovarius tibetensis]|uniref:class I SAM-dependent methyltransferase n=1 Tax=Roseovarius tibetensis TaxID=2685897 RepID=UPI003D7F9EC3
MYQPFDKHFAGLSPTDGTVDFYFRVNALADPAGTYLDYGAGRAGWFEDDPIAPRRALRSMKGKFAKVIAADIDPVVMENRSADRTVMISEDRVELEDESADVIVADYVIEHIADPGAFAGEISRLLRPGGWFCARTPHRAHYIALAERIIPERIEGRVLGTAQPGRKAMDVFPKTYRMNTLVDIAAAFPGWTNRSFCRRCDPAYFFGSRPIYQIADFMHRVMPAPFCGNIFVFLQKPSPGGSNQ